MADHVSSSCVQVLASNCCSLLWNTYMSYKSHH